MPRIIVLTQFQRNFSFNYCCCVSAEVYFRFSSPRLCLEISVYCSVRLSLCAVTLRRNPNGSCHLQSETLHSDREQRCGVPLVSRQPAPDNLHPSSLHARTNQNRAPRERREIPHTLRGNISADLLCKTVNMTFRMRRRSRIAPIIHS